MLATLPRGFRRCESSAVVARKHDVMRSKLWILAVAFVVGCAKERGRTKTEDFFVTWLQQHGETNIVVDANGVGIASNATRLKASVYGSNRHPNGTWVVETEFRIRLPAGGEIVEFVAGMADGEEKALDDSLLNFTLTTFHVVYKSFINAADPHQTLERLMVNGAAHELAMGDLYLRGSSTNGSVEMSAVRKQIGAAIESLPLSSQPHWIKIVYSQENGMPRTVAATLDNTDHDALTALVKGFDWPKRSEFYMAKQFIVVK